MNSYIRSVKRRHLLRSICAVLAITALLSACGTSEEVTDSGTRTRYTTTEPLIRTTPDTQTDISPIITTADPVTQVPTTVTSVTTSPNIQTTVPATVTTTEPITTTKPVTQTPTTVTSVTTSPNIQTTVPETVTTTEPITQAPSVPDPNLNIFENAPHSAKYVLLYDITDDRMLYISGSGEEMVYPASITKLLTALYALTVVPDTSEIFTVGKDASDSSKANIRQSEAYTMRDMLICMLLPSGNDAAYTVAVNCGMRMAGGETVTNRQAFDLFIEGMNRYGEEVLGLTGTHFDSPDGYHSDNHYTTMNDLLKISLAAYQNPVISEIAAMAEHTVETVNKSRKLELTNTNQMLQSKSKVYYPYTTGLKTGTHSQAGCCVSATAKKDGRELLVLILKSKNNTERFVDAITYLELGFALLEESGQAA